MWPDTLPGDPAFADLEAELTAAGDRASRQSPNAPTPAFAADLRARLVAAYGPAAPAESAALAGRAPIARVSSSSLTHGGPARWEPAPVSARTVRRTSTVLPAPGWALLGLAATIVVAIAGLDLGAFFGPPPAARAVAAIDATLVRDGSTVALGSGERLREGDEIRTAGEGRATLQLGGSTVRLAAGADLRLVTLTAAETALDQVRGRAWHRVDIAEGARYAVTTGAITWTADGTAFALDRSGAGAAGGDIVAELSVQHDVTVDGPGLRVTVAEGHGATVQLDDGPTVATVAVSPVTAAADPWVRENAAADAAAGWSVGMLDGVAIATGSPTSEAPGSPVPTSLATVSATPSPTLDPTLDPTGEPTLTATPRPTPRATPKPTPNPTEQPTPTPAPTMTPMELSAFACPGGVVLGWSLPELPTFDRLQLLRGTTESIPPTDPPAAGVTALDGGSTTNPSVRDGADATASAGSAWYRAVAFDADGRAIAASPVRGVTVQAPGSLGDLAITDGAPGSGQLTFDWAAATGGGDCFSYLKIVASTDDPSPSYLTGAQALAAFEAPGTVAATVDGLGSGTTKWFRVQVLRITSLGSFVVTETTPIQHTVP